jgi:hypothetical protein
MSRLAAAALALVLVSGRSVVAPAQPAPAPPAPAPPAPEVPPEAPAPEAAERDFADGVDAAARKDWAAASTAFERSFELGGRPDALFAWAQAERLGGRCERAVPLYRRFLALGPRPEHAQAADIGLRRCAAVPPGPPPPPPDRPDWIGGGLVALGSVGVGVGLLLVTLSVSHDRAAGRAGIDYDEYLSNMDRARLERPLGIGVGVLGTALLASGIVRLLLAPAARETSVAVAPGGRGLELTWGRRF